jgi:hypothetical protein
MLFEEFKNFDYSGIYMNAYLNEEGELKKNTIHPNKKLYENIKHYYEPIFFRGNMIEPNAIQIDTSKITTIDIDKPDQCIILDRLKKDCKFYIKTRKGYHFYFNNNNKILCSQNGKRRILCDIADINCNKLYYCPKYTDEDNNIYSYEIIKSKKLVDVPDYVVDWCNQLILNTYNKKEEPKKLFKRIEKIEYKPNIEINKFSIDIIKHIYEIYYNVGKFENFDTWCSIAYFSRHLNNSYEVAELFDEYSRKVDKYKSKAKEENIKMFYGDNKYNINFNEEGILLQCSKLDYNYYVKYLRNLKKDKYENFYNHINSQYLYTDDNKHIYSKWMTSYKCLMIKSSYGTGKTFLFKKLMEEYKYKKVLFITYRQSLAYSLIEELRKEYGFKSYLDENIQCNKEHKLIIQLDSIEKLKSNYFFETQKSINTNYDLIVLDEIEGILNHLSYDMLNQYLINNTLEQLIYKSKKILCLDGDLSNRSFDFINNLELDYKIYINSFQPNKKHFIMTSDKEYFNNKINEDLKNNKKIVIVSMSSSECDYYENMYKEKYKVIKHTGIHKDKETLMDVNNKWNTCDLLTYSPVVESGVDFNIKYFDKCYIIFSLRSTTYRALSQMINRVRYYSDNNIICYFNEDQIKYDTFLYPYTFDDFKLSKYGDMELTNLLNIIIHNDVEKYNTKNYLIASFINLIYDKGHTYEKIENLKFKISTQSTEQKISNINKAIDIDNNEYRKIIEKQRQNKEITENEQYQINKYIMKEKWLLKELDEEIIKNHIDKDYILENYLNLISGVSVEHKNEIKINTIKKQIEKVKEIIKDIGFDLDNRDIQISHDVYTTNINKVIEKMNTKDFKILFTHSKIKFVKSRISEFFDDWGLCFESKKVPKRDGDKVKKITYHKLSNINIIDDYLKRVIN